MALKKLEKKIITACSRLRKEQERKGSRVGVEELVLGKLNSIGYVRRLQKNLGYCIRRYLERHKNLKLDNSSSTILLE